jgi:putative ABC transport system permease protein
MGAGRSSLIGQFLGEAVMLSTLALGVACILVELSLPAFNAFTAKTLTLWSGDTPLLLPGLVLLTLVVGIAAGTYPAFFLSAFQPANALKNSRYTGTGGSSLWLRKGLVILQFSISILLIIGTLIMAQQMAYLKNKHLGFQKDQILVFSQSDQTLLPEVEAVKAELLQHANVLEVAASAGILGQQSYGSTTFRNKESREDEWVMAYVLFVDDQFLPTLDIGLAAGRNFSADIASDRESGCIINEAAMARFGWSSPDMAVGKPLITTGTEQREEKITIIGVVKDFHFASLHHKVEPLVLQTQDDILNHYYIKLRARDIPETLTVLEQTFKAFAPNYPVRYVFLDDRFEALYYKEKRMQQIFGYCSFLAIFIACLGLFGLASFMTAQRTKEIGIRKTLGASVTNITFLLSKEFTTWVLLANVIAWPIAYVVMNRWLQSFAYRITIAPWIFLVAAIMAVLIALITVSGRTIKAALANPVDALRYE